MRKITVAIDGPAGAGKSSVAKMVANRLHYLYIDTGAMYRAFTWAMLERHVDIEDEQAVRQLTDSIQIRLEPRGRYMPRLCRRTGNNRRNTHAFHLFSCFPGGSTCSSTYKTGTIAERHGKRRRRHSGRPRYRYGSPAPGRS